MSEIESSVELGAMLHHLNRFVLRNLASSGFFFTLAAARLSRSRRTLEFAGAGHPPAMMVRPGCKPQLLESRSAVLGLIENAVDAEATIEVPIQEGDRLVIYTDGFTESFNSQEETLGIDRFSEIVRETAALPVSRMKEQIV
jgi:sigma-B regulation protein RsbU (phosphoserine phosphatase)